MFWSHGYGGYTCALTSEPPAEVNNPTIKFKLFLAFSVTSNWCLALAAGIWKMLHGSDECATARILHNKNTVWWTDTMLDIFNCLSWVQETQHFWNRLYSFHQAKAWNLFFWYYRVSPDSSAILYPEGAQHFAKTGSASVLMWKGADT